jgi:hypothetical protein
MPDWPSSQAPMRQLLAHAVPEKGLPDHVNEWREQNFRHVLDGAWRIQLARAMTRVTKIPHLAGALWGVVVRGDGSVENLGLMGLKVVTTAGVNFLVDALQGTVEPEILRFHGYGTGSTAEASGDTALVTELTTEYNPNSTRPTGTLAEGASANIFRTVGVLTPDSGAPVLREHGIFSANAAGTLLDRTVFAAVTVDSGTGDSLTTTYELTLAAGS